jgi:CO/xanthine dehydrogenase FAD-binding subunit
VRGTALGEDTLAAVTALIDKLAPPDDIEVSGTYRRRVAGVLARRALVDAAVRAAAKEAS